MPLRYRRFITRQNLRAAPDTLFVFGDNLERRGLGGQAAEMRDEPSAVGVPTKHQPSRRAEAYFSDADFAAVKPSIDMAMMRLAGRRHRHRTGRSRTPRAAHLALPGTLSQRTRTALVADIVVLSFDRLGCRFGAWPTLRAGHRALLAKACGGVELRRRPKLAEPNSPAGRPC